MATVRVNDGATELVIEPVLICNNFLMDVRIVIKNTFIKYDKVYKLLKYQEFLILIEFLKQVLNMREIANEKLEFENDAISFESYISKDKNNSKLYKTVDVVIKCNPHLKAAKELWKITLYEIEIQELLNQFIAEINALVANRADI